MRNSVIGVVAASLYCLACAGAPFSSSSNGGSSSAVTAGSDAGGRTTTDLASGGELGNGGSAPETGNATGADGGQHAGGASPTGGRWGGLQGGRASAGGRAPTGGTAPNGGTETSVSTGGTSTATTDPTVYGDPISGQYHLGPVDFAQTRAINACTPVSGFRDELRDVTGLGGEYLVGLTAEHAQVGGMCDACIFIKTATGQQIIARVITYGVESGAGDIDVSPSVYAALNTGEYPRNMTWQFAKCPDLGPLQYEFQTEANPWWTSLWVRNPRVPISKVEVKSVNHADFFTLRRETDGTVNDDNGFGEGAFTLRITGIDGQVITDSWPGFSAGQLIVSTKQFQ